MEIDAYKIEQYIREYVVNNYDTIFTTAGGYSLDILYNDPSRYSYSHEDNEIVIQQVPGLTVEIKRDLIQNFGLKYLRTIQHTPYYAVYPYFSVYKIVNRRKLLKRLKDEGFNVDIESSEEKAVEKVIQNKEAEKVKTQTSTVSAEATQQRKRKYNLPKYICFDIRTTLCRKKPTYDVTLASDDNKAHSTKTLTVYEAVTKVVENRIKYKGWTSDDVANYINTYDFTMENQYSLKDACDKAGVTEESVLSGEYMKLRYGTKKVEIEEVEEKEIAKNISTEIIENDKKEKYTKNNRKAYLEYLKNNPQWFNIANFPEYEIYSEPYLFTNEYNKTCWTYRIRNLITKKEIKPTTKSNSMYVNINGINKAIYKLAADTFLHNPNKKRDTDIIATEIHHLNGDHSDNRLENLEHVTKEMHGEFHKQINKSKPREFLKFAQIMQIKAERSKGKSLYKISEELGIDFHKVKSAVEKDNTQLARVLKREQKLCN